jgi:hypothetical protein
MMVCGRIDHATNRSAVSNQDHARRNVQLVNHLQLHGLGFIEVKILQILAASLRDRIPCEVADNLRSASDALVSIGALESWPVEYLSNLT